MGQEIFYCSACQTQLRSADFEKGKAHKLLGLDAICAKCVPEALKTLPPEKLAALQKAFPYGVSLDKGWTQKQWDDKMLPLLFLHPQSGGHGLNLQYGSHTMVIYSASFSYEQMAQTRARVDRQGQTTLPVFHFLQAVDTVDDLLLEVLEAKKISQATVLSMVKEYADARR